MRPSLRNGWSSNPRQLSTALNCGQRRPCRKGRAATKYDISFSLKKTGADKFGAWTGANVNEYMGVVLNDEVKSIAFIKSQIFDQGEITGNFTKEQGEDLALTLAIRCFAGSD